MSRILGIAPLRSLVAVADCGGFQRAARSLHLSQAAVSQHVRRLESALGERLIQRDGRGSRFTPDGERLLGYARRIVALHDETLLSFGVGANPTLLIGSTEHAAAQLLPDLSAALADSLPDHQVRFRIDRGTALREAITARRIDLALLLGPADEPGAAPVGELELTWYAAPSWRRPAAAEPIPLVAFDHPCALRTRAFEVLSEHGIAAVIGAEAIQLAGVQAAVGAGLGVALMATLGQTPEGMVRRDDLPRARPLPVAARSRADLPAEVSHRVVRELRRLLTDDAPEHHLQLARGA
jgi:DNA-binding transcriptional LysR family regulator